MKMNQTIPDYFKFSVEVLQAKQSALPIVALESAVITHGLPYPQNIHLAQDVEAEIRSNHAIPATIAVIDGKICIGLTEEEIERLAREKNVRKISRRDFAIAISENGHGGTTVAGTMIAAREAGLQVFSTGGIGGVHRNAPFDISADLPELSHSAMIVVCTGAKAILDLPATLEYLETVGVPVIGYQTDEFPAFYSRQSGLKVNASADTPDEIVAIAKTHWNLGLGSAILVVNPPPADVALPKDEIETIIRAAVKDAEALSIHGAAVTPYLLNRVNELSGGASLRANLSLLRNNARLAAQIAVKLRQ
jgi:pseudouridine-5'-phosphate glycosidase